MAKFIIHRGQPFYTEFVIKDPGASVPMDITGATGTFSLTEIGVSPCLVLEEPMAVVDGPNGIMSVNLTEAQTIQLTGKKGFPEDGYALMPTYTANLDIGGLDEPIQVSVLRVYIMDQGIPCPIA